MTPKDDLTLRTATAADTPGIHGLLQRCGLPTSDLDPGLQEFVIASRGERLIGTGALERYGRAALLRSVAVETEERGSGVGRLVVMELERRARLAGVGELVLLTLTAQDVFERLGYRVKDRGEVPTDVRESAEFRSLCPVSATCMAKELAPT